MKKLFAIILLSTTVAFSQTKDWKTFNDKNCTVQYPSDWELNESGELGTTFFVFSPIESADDKFRENVNLIIQDLKGQKVSLDQYTTISEDQIKTMITNSKMIKSERIKNEQGEHHHIIYTGDQGAFHLKFEQCYWLEGNNAYILTFTSEKAKYNDYAERADKILKSFKLKN